MKSIDETIDFALLNKKRIIVFGDSYTVKGYVESVQKISHGLLFKDVEYIVYLIVKNSLNGLMKIPMSEVKSVELDFEEIVAKPKIRFLDKQ